LKPRVFKEITAHADAGKQNASTVRQNSPSTNIKLSNSNLQPSTSNLQSSTTHEVLPKESLYGISKKYGVTVDELKKWNNLTSDHIQTGQQLIISK